MQTKEDFYNFMEERKKLVKNYIESNCLGTASYLTGQQNKDEYVSPVEKPTLEGLTESKEPLKGVIEVLVYEQDNKKIVYHTFVVDEEKPLMVLQRETARGAFNKKSLKEVLKENRENSPFDLTVEYRVPLKLEKTQDKEAA